MKNIMEISHLQEIKDQTRRFDPEALEADWKNLSLQSNLSKLRIFASVHSFIDVNMNTGGHRCRTREKIYTDLQLAKELRQQDFDKWVRDYKSGKILADFIDKLEQNKTNETNDSCCLIM